MLHRAGQGLRQGEGGGGRIVVVCVANLLRRVLIAKSSQNQSLSHKAAEQHTVDTSCDN